MYCSQFSYIKSDNKTSKFIKLNIKDSITNSGARDIKEYKNHSKRLCGITCIQMILKYYLNIDISVFELFYKFQNLGYFHDLNVGLNYEDLSTFFNKYNLKTHTYRTSLTIDKLCENIHNNICTVISIKPLNLETTDFINEGHLVLVSGYDLKKKCIYINDPGGIFEKNNFKDREILFTELDKVFSNRGFSVNM